MRSIFRFFAVALAFVVCLPLYAGLYSKPHKMYVLKVANFSIIFPEQSSFTARLICEHCEEFFSLACEKTSLAETFTIPVVITPDTAELSVTYSQQPYNRIIVCDSFAKKDEVYSTQMLLDLFYKAVLEAAAYTVRSKNWRMVHTLTGVDLFQPIYLLNVTSAFVDGAVGAWDDSDIANLTDDMAYEALVQAKMAKKFPTWKQVSGVSDSALYSRIQRIACSAFSAYIMQRWGVEQFVSYWNECGRVHFFALMPGIFRKVYGVSLSNTWRDFVDAIEIPDEMYQDSLLRSFSEKLLARQDYHIENIVKAKNGIIWYDRERKEVCFLAENKMRKRWKSAKKLFSASDVSRLSISTDRRYLAVSSYRSKAEDVLTEPYTKIYDLDEKKFLRGAYPIAEACIVQIPYHKYAVAGVASTGQNGEMRMYLVNDSNHDDILMTRQFATGSTPYQFCSTGKNQLLCLVNEDDTHKLLSISLPEGEEKSYELSFNVRSMQGADGKLCFSYASDEGDFFKMGYLTVTVDGSVTKGFVVDSTLDGSVVDPFLSASDFVYAMHRRGFDELYRVKKESLEYTEMAVLEAQSVKAFSKADLPVIEKKVIHDEDGEIIKTALFLDEYQISRYNPLKFMARKLIYFFLPITSLDIEDGYNMTVGAGFSYFTNEDALENSQLILSYSGLAVDPADDYLGITADNIFTAIYNNSILPVKVSVGGNWAVQEEGQYTLTALGSLTYRHPVGYSYQNLTFSLQDLWTASTQHRDRYTKEENTKMDWTYPSNAYKDNVIRTGVSYSTYRQSGLTSFEQLGFEIKQYFLYEVDFAQDKMQGDKTIIDVFDSDKYERSSVSVSYGFKLPRLLPFATNSVVWTLPTAASVSLYGESGTALSWNAESVLLGIETQTGLVGMPLYLHRLGLIGGYHGDFEYDTLVIPGPDFAAIKEFVTVFTESELNDYVYLAGFAAVSPIAGVMTKAQITADCQLRYYFREHAYKMNFSLKTNF